MFDIDFLITNKISEMLDKEKNHCKKSEILINLMAFEENFPDLAEEISDFWFKNTGERYSEPDFFLSSDDKEFIGEYAERINSLDKVKQLINKLCSISDGVYDYDKIISEASNEIYIISNISDFEFSDRNNKSTLEKPKKTSLDVLLSRRM